MLYRFFMTALLALGPLHGVAEAKKKDKTEKAKAKEDANETITARVTWRHHRQAYTVKPWSQDGTSEEIGNCLRFGEA